MLPPDVRGAGPLALSVSPDADDPYREVGRLVQTLLATGADDIYRRVLEVFDQLVIRDALRHVGGSQVRASEVLGIARATLRAKLQTRDRRPVGADKKLNSPGDGEEKN